MAQMLRYRKADTFLHIGLHPLTKMAVFFAVMFTAGLWLDVRLLIFLLLGGIIAAVVSKTPAKWFRFLFAALLLTWYPTLLTTIAQVRPEYYKVLDPVWASTNILTYNFPIVDRLGLTYGSVYFLAGRLARFATVVTWAIVFIATTPMSDIANTLYALRVPQPIVFVLQITYKFIPYMASVLNQISDAQRLRGWNLRTWNPIKIARRSLPLANPLLRRTAIIIDQVTTATQIRGFGSARVTPLTDLNLRPLDRIIIAASIAGFLAAVLGVIFFKIGMI